MGIAGGRAFGGGEELGLFVLDESPEMRSETLRIGVMERSHPIVKAHEHFLNDSG